MREMWSRQRWGGPGPPKVRVTLELSDRHGVDYRDPRLFGRLVRGKVEELRQFPSWRALGPDPLPGIDVDRLHAALVKTKRSLKEALMDQRTLAGLGNIHVSEALHRARLDPRQPGSTMTRAETDRLADGIREGLRF